MDNRDDFHAHWHEDASAGVHIGLWIALIAGVAAGALLGFVAVKAIANAAHAVTHAHEWRF